ncbi:hypothetical protein NSQ77_12125 [Oceanobacillus sp. FSL K6-2867]|uniref:hypothetical protein n=1 Tax=Oceanobacillus sp. FSL K6-2867 TaxID=2954748 RepID=UPI0030D9C0B5
MAFFWGGAVSERDGAMFWRRGAVSERDGAVCRKCKSGSCMMQEPDNVTPLLYKYHS